jgi:pimeloyl-ACP methyl ester carboxylesterase
MRNESRVSILAVWLCVLLAAVATFGQTTTPTPAPGTKAPTGKTPVIIIPGLTGSNLVNSRTGEEVWFKARRSKDDDIRLPISPNLAQNRDNLTVKDIIRKVEFFKVLPEIEVYERLIDALQTRGGYREANWNTATRKDAQDTFFVFPYDWRRDNVENAQLLMRKIDTLKRRLGKPNLKFNIVAHSMGGLIARYAAMYGSANLPASNPQPTWAGDKNFDKVFLLGTPNEGSISSLNALLNGFSYIGGGLNLPFIQDISRFDAFTIPSIYQLLPHDGALLAYDENLKPVTVDLYDPAEWEKYGWAIWQDDAFTKKFSASEQKNARPFFVATLARAKQFQAALDAVSNTKPSASLYLIGGDCKPTPAGMLLFRDEKKNRWETRFKADGFTRPNGEKVKDTEIEPLLLSVGDSVVTKSSLTGENRKNGLKSAFPVTAELYQCVGHNKLVTSPEVQDKLLGFLNGARPVSAIP